MAWDWNEHRDSLHVAVLAGGDSPEREISLASGINCEQALLAAGHQTALIDPQSTPLTRETLSQFDACFMALHGGAGEDGRVQQCLDRTGIPYTGSGPNACRLAMSKSASKERFLQAGVPTPSYSLVESNTPDRLLGDIIECLGTSLVVKPDSQGSSLGVRIVHSPDELRAAIRHASTFDDFLLLERRIIGRELTVSLIDRRPLPIIEILTPHGTFFDYQAKYQSPATRYICDPQLEPSVRDRIVAAAVSAAESLGTRGVARVDLMLDQRDQVWVLELNAVPGMTSHSLVPMAAAHAGMNLPSLCDRLVRACMPTRSAS